MDYIPKWDGILWYVYFFLFYPLIWPDISSIKQFIVSLPLPHFTYIYTHIHTYVCVNKISLNLNLAFGVLLKMTGVQQEGDDQSVSLHLLKQKMADFAKERNWDQFHSPRNLLLAMVTYANTHDSLLH